MPSTPHRTTPGLAVENLSHSYGRTKALDDVTLSVPPATFCALLGPNGAGKSTLFALLTRLFVADEGRIAIAGHALGRDPRAALAHMGVVFQQPTLDLDVSVAENMLYYAALHDLDRRAARPRVKAVLERLAMAERAGEKVRALNGGHRRRMEIARALLHEPDVLLLDEPTVGLDAASRDAIVGHVHDLAADGLSVLWATHLVDEVRDDDALVVLHRGRVVANGMAAQVRADAPLGERFRQLTSEAVA